MEYFDELSDKELEIFMHCLAKFSGYYYETKDLYIRVLSEYLVRRRNI